MVDDKGSVFPFGNHLFTHIFRSFRMAIQPSKLVIAFAAVTAICLTGRLMDLSRTVVVTSGPSIAGFGRLMDAESSGEATELDLYMMSPAELPALLKSSPSRGDRVGVFATLWHFGQIQFHSVLRAIFTLDVPGFIAGITRCAGAMVWAFRYHTLYSLIFFTIVLIILSLAGGALCRIAALQFARGERPGIRPALRFSRRKFTNLVVAPIGPLVIALLLGLPIILLGALGNIPFAGELLTGLLLPLALILAPFIAVVLIGVVAGLSLLFPAIAYEDSDSFDAISRSFSSVYARPWRMGFYTLAAAVYGAVCYLFVRFFAFLVLWVTRGFLQLGLRDEKLRAIWPEPDFDNLLGVAATAPETWSLWLGALLIRLWTLAVAGLVVSFIVSFCFSASTVIYALLRNRVDGTPLDEVYEDSGEALPESVQADASSQAQSPPATGGTSE